jgi:hypothetical protein
MQDLFALDCTTCKSRLRVRDGALVGQIMACPKCGSMVLIEAPPGWKPPVAPHAAAAAAAAPNDAQRAGQPPNFSAPKRVGNDPELLKETASDTDFGEIDSLFGKPGSEPRPSPPRSQQRPSTAAGAATIAAPAPVGREEAAAGEASSALPKPDWTPQHIKRVRLLGMLTLAGGMGIALALGTAMFISKWASGRTEIAENPSPVLPNASPVVAEPTDVVPPATNDVDTPDEQSSDDAAPPDSQPSPPSNPPSSELPDDTNPPGTESPDDQEPAPPAGIRDPLGIVDDPVPPKRERPDNDPLRLEELRQLARLIPGEGAPPGDESSAIDSSDSSERLDDGSDAPASRPRPERKEIDLPARLADRLVAVEFTGQPLSEVVSLLSNLSTIPITLDPESLAWSRITPAAPVRLQLSNATIEEVLVETLKPFRLEPIVVGDHVVVSRSPKLRLIKSPVGDLTGGDPAKTAGLIEHIEALAMPSAWKSAGGEGSIAAHGDMLHVECSELAYGEVMHLCERLRVARGGRPKSVFPPEMFALEPRTQRAAKRLTTPLTLNFSQPTQLSRILDRFAQESGMVILVDWQVAAEAGWPMDADATVTLDKTPLSAALIELLSPMDLTYRVVDDRTLQVTTAEAIARRPEIEVYRLIAVAPSAEDGAALSDRLAREFGEAGVIRHDAASNSLLALLPQPLQERLAERLSEEMTEE